MPSEWSLTDLGQVLSLEYGKGLVAENRTGAGYPVFGSSGEVGRHSDALVNGPGIVVGRKGTVGSVIWTDEPFWPIDTAYFVEPKSKFDLRWLFWKLGTLGLGKLDSSTGVPGLNRNDAYEKAINLPPLPEQRRIAEILDTLDEAIRKTEQVIKKLQQMKQGLLHDLLTRGINEHGELRDPQRHPGQFKDSPLGRIPKEWEVTPLVDVLSVELGFAFRSEDYVNEGLLSFRVSNIGRSADDFGEVRKLPHKFWDLFPGQQLSGGEIVLVMVGATTGKLGRVPAEVCPALQNQNMWHLKPVLGVLRDFLWLVLPDAVARHMALSQGSARDFLTQKAFLPTEVVRPPQDEQERLVRIAEAHDRRVEDEHAELKKLRTLKQGLMDDLLTGRVRVSVEEVSA